MLEFVRNKRWNRNEIVKHKNGEKEVWIKISRNEMSLVLQIDPKMLNQNIRPKTHSS